MRAIEQHAAIARSPKLAAAYLNYWNALKADTEAGDGKGKQDATLRSADGSGPVVVELEDGSATVDVWFSPNTPKGRARSHVHEATPPDLQEVSDRIAAARQAVLFVAFEPGEPSVIDAIGAAQKANPSLFVRGTVTVARAAEDFAIAIKGDAKGDSTGKPLPSGERIPVDYRVIPAKGIKDPIGVRGKELNSAGFAVTHSKFIVIDPFSDGCVVITGSHNLGFQASYDNDENMAIIKGHRALADDQWQNSYFDAAGRPVSPQLGFWLASSPSADALPTPAAFAPVSREEPALHEIRQRHSAKRAARHHER